MKEIFNPSLHFNQARKTWLATQQSFEGLSTECYFHLNSQSWHLAQYFYMMVQEAAISLDFYFDPLNKICFCILGSRL